MFPIGASMPTRAPAPSVDVSATKEAFRLGSGSSSSALTVTHHLLESNELTVDQVAGDVGFATGAALRRHFATELGVGWDQVGAVELNKAFAAQSLACINAWGIGLADSGNERATAQSRGFGPCQSDSHPEQNGGWFQPHWRVDTGRSKL